ncbi:hypothetical protein Nepgr_008158 [Nepenthes gracilis]|uniref:Uncharacterized protein n=1 Tax=Nepenthes gracilis TaxID=150966 RepID=A0AAD3S865_NEPGR|nr:hypothetical protein Nepgr_008158 [Nepenthes gracilis]
MGRRPLKHVTGDHLGHGQDSMHTALRGVSQNLAGELGSKSLPLRGSRQKEYGIPLVELASKRELSLSPSLGLGLQETSVLANEEEQMDVPESVGVVGAGEAEQTSKFIDASETGGLGQELESVEVPEAMGSLAGAYEIVALSEHVSVPPSLEDPGSSLPEDESFKRSEPLSMDEVAEPAEPPSVPASGVASRGIGSSFAQALETVHSLKAVSSHLDKLLCRVQEEAEWEVIQRFEMETAALRREL